MKRNTEQIKYWQSHETFKKFRTQMTAYVYVALKNGVPPKQVLSTVKHFFHEQIKQWNETLRKVNYITTREKYE